MIWKVEANTHVRLNCLIKGVGLIVKVGSNGFFDIYHEWGLVSCIREDFTVMRDQSKASTFVPMRIYLPYGVYFCDDGSEVLFSREYCPMWAKHPNGKISDISPRTFVHHKKSELFFDAGDPPHKNREALNKCLGILHKWGVANRTSLFTQIMLEEIRNGGVDILFPTSSWGGICTAENFGGVN